MRTVAPTRPIQLSANTIPSFYRGRGRIGLWRGESALEPTDPEDWVASTSRRTGMGDRGLTVLPEGTRLVDAIQEHPVPWLGDDASGTRMLLKLLDAGERLPVHVHPDGSYARTHLHQPNGKAEAWLVLVAEPDSMVHIGFRDDVAPEMLERWVAEQDVPALLGSMNRVAVAAGDVIYCPPGVPHAIGSGILVVEIQEPSDSSIMLEWDGFPIDAGDRFAGLDRSTALQAVDRSGYGTRLGELTGPSFLAIDSPGSHELLPAAAHSYFRADLLITADDRPVTVPAAFSVLFVACGHGEIVTAGGVSGLAAGQVWLVPYAAGECALQGSLRVIRCRPTSTTGRA